jgi:tetratricopeptide (TPR) repeat protein
MKQNDSSEYWYQKILTASPYDTYATQKLSNIYIRTAMYEKGLRLTKEYLEHDTLPNPVMKQHAWFYHLLKDYKTAVSGFRKCLRSGDSSLFVFSKLGISYYKQEIFDSAELYFRQAWELDTTDAENCFYYGVSASRSFLADTGILYLNKTLQLVMPSEAFLTNIYVELAEAYNNKSDYNKALEVLEKIHSTYPDNKRTWFRIAYQYDYYLRDRDKALENYELYMKDEPENLTDKEEGTETTFGIYARKRIKEINLKKAQQK